MCLCPINIKIKRIRDEPIKNVKSMLIPLGSPTGVITAVAPRTKKIFKTFEPTTYQFPTLIHVIVSVKE